VKPWAASDTVFPADIDLPRVELPEAEIDIEDMDIGSHLQNFDRGGVGQLCR
jgi:hypothetical protein